MMGNFSFDFYYGKEAEQFNFYRIPKLLFTDKKFSEISIEAKVLYGLLLDRLSLSIKNGGVDEDNRVYIYFKVTEAMEYMNICKEKAIKLFAELDAPKGSGLIFRKRQGLGKPSVIYVMNFNSGVCEDAEIDDAEIHDITSSEKQTFSGMDSTDFKKSEKQTSGGMDSTDFKKLEMPTSGGMESELQEVGDLDTNDNNNNYTDNSDNNLISSYQGEIIPDSTTSEKETKMLLYTQVIQNAISYKSLITRFSKERIDEIVSVMTDVVCSEKSELIIGGESVPQRMVSNRIMKLNETHIEYVIECMDNTTTKIKNIKQYLITALYNSVSTIDHYYSSQVRHDLINN